MVQFEHLFLHLFNKHVQTVAFECAGLTEAFSFSFARCCIPAKVHSKMSQAETD